MAQVILVHGEKVNEHLENWHGTIAEAALAVMPGGSDLPFIAVIDGEPILRKNDGWNVEVPEGKAVIFVQLPMGGGRGGSGMVVQVVAMVAATVASAYLGGAGGALVGALGQTGANITAGIVSMGIMMAGSLIANAMTTSQGRVSSSSAETASPTYSINASGNMARLNQPEPEGFGKMQIVPDYVSQPWTSYEDNEEWGHFVFALGRGNYDVESMSFGDTTFWKNGQFVQSTIITSAGSEVTTTVGISDLPRSWSGPWVITGENSIAGSVKIKIRYPYGCWTNGETESEAANDYHPKAYTVIYKARFARCDASGNITGSWSSAQTVSATYNTRNEFTEEYSIPIPDTGRLAMQVARDGAAMYFNGLWVADESNVQIPVFNFVSYSVVGSNTSSVANAKVEMIYSGGHVTIFQDNIFTTTEVSNLSLLAPNQDSYIGYSGPYTVCPAGVKINKIFIDYSYANGLGKYDSNGTLQNYTVNFTVQYRQINDNGDAVGDWVTRTYSNTGKTTTPQRKTISWSVTAGRYQVRMIRTSFTSLDSKNPTLDSLVWSGLRGKITTTPTYPLSCVAVQIRASNALSQQGMSQFKCVVTRKLPIYNTSTKKWSSPTATRSWAAALCQVCKESWGGGMSDSALDLQAIWKLDAQLQAKGWYFDAYIDSAFSMWQLITEMCQCVMAVPRMLGTVLSVVEDKYGRPVSFELSPRNIVRDSFSVTYNTWNSSTPDSVIINYLDKDHGWQREDIQTTLPNAESTEPVTLDWMGITSRTQAFRVATAYAARNRHRRVSVTCQVEGLGRVINVGDVVQVNHPRFHNTGGGQIVRVVPGILTAYIKRDFVQSVGSASYFSVTLPNGSVWGPVRMSSYTEEKVVLDAADHAVYIARGNPSFDSVLSESMDLRALSYAVHSSSAFQRRMIVQSVTVDDLWHFTVTLVNDAPEVENYNSLSVPAWGA